MKFTLDHSKNGKGVPFLDTYVTVELNGNQTAKVETELYIKPTNSGIVLHATSAHPTSTKHNMIRGMFRRALNLSSSKTREASSVEKIRLLLIKNGYSRNLLKRLLREVQDEKRTKQKRGDRQNAGNDGYLTLPYIDEHLLCKVKNIVRKSGLNVKLAWRNDRKLKKRLVRSAFSKPRCPGGNRCNLCKSGFAGQCTQKNVVYILTCKLCSAGTTSAQYVGETKRPIRLRYNEHVRDAIGKKPDTPMGDHFGNAHPNASDISSCIDVSILYRAMDHPDRKIAESILIRKRRPELNSNVSSWPIMKVYGFVSLDVIVSYM